MISLLRSCQVGCWGKNKSSGLNAIRAGLISINLSASAGRCPGFAASRTLALAPLPPRQRAMQQHQCGHLEYDLHGCGRRAGPLCPPLPRNPHRSAFHLALEDAAHIKVLDRKRRFGREAKSLKGRMKALTQHGSLNRAVGGDRKSRQATLYQVLACMSCLRWVCVVPEPAVHWVHLTFKRNITKQSPLIVSLKVYFKLYSTAQLYYLLLLIEIIIFMSAILKHNKL